MDQTNQHPQLARRLGLFDATMIVMGGIIGSGIFMNPSVVALQVHTPFLVLGAWVLGGLFALAAAFIWAELSYLPISTSLLAALVLATLTIINCLGVRAGSTVQGILMVLKILAIAMLVVCGFVFASRSTNPSGLLDRPPSFDLLTAFGAAMVPVIFAYGGWQTATFVAGEIKEP